MTIINATNHNINLYKDNMCCRIFKPSGYVIRLSTTESPIEDIDGVPVKRIVYCDAQSLPVFKDDTMYIVSLIVKANYPNRRDFIVPSDQVYNDAGLVIGCQSFSY